MPVGVLKATKSTGRSSVYALVGVNIVHLIVVCLRFGSLIKSEMNEVVCFVVGLGVIVGDGCASGMSTDSSVVSACVPNVR